MTGPEFACAFDGIRAYLVGYEDFIHQSELALLSRDHLVAFGESGRGKSYACRTLVQAISGARLFKTQLDRDTQSDYLIGAAIPRVYLEEGRHVYNLLGGLADADLAHIDEVADAPASLMRALNTLINERRFERKDQDLDAPLHTIWFTANWLPMSREWEAVWERILFRFRAPRVSSAYERFSMHRAYLKTEGRAPSLRLIPFEELKALSDQTRSLPVPSGVHLLLGHVAGDYEAGISQLTHALRTSISGRTENALLNVLRAAALLEGRRVGYKHLHALRYALCTMGEDENGAHEQRLLADILERCLPRDRAEEQVYDSLGDLADQIRDCEQNGAAPDGHSFRVWYPWMDRAKTVIHSHLQAHLVEVRGRVGFETARHLVDELRHRARHMAH